MAYNVISLGYDELKSVLREVNTRRRRWRLAGDDRIHRGLVEACVGFAKMGFRIVDKMVISRLCVAFRELRVAKRGLRILLEGEVKAAEMQIQYRTRGVFKWAPKLETWLKIRGYKLWLGTIQYSLASNACPCFENGGHQPSVQ